MEEEKYKEFKASKKEMQWLFYIINCATTIRIVLELLSIFNFEHM